MSDRVIVFVADAKFYPHIKAVAVNCRRDGAYDGDFLLIHPDDLDASDLTARGFATLPVSDRGFLMKFNIFHPMLRRWRQALFLDADVVVQRPLYLLFDQLTRTPVAAYGAKPILADREEMPAFLAWKQWDPEHEQHGMRVERQPDTSIAPIVTPGTIYATLQARFPHVFGTERMFNTSMMLFEPGGIPDGTVERLRELQAEFAVCNEPAKGGTDQQVIDLLLHQRMDFGKEKCWCYWGLDEHASRVPSVSRGWVGGEIPIVVHMARWYAQWLVKASNADAYFNDRLGVVVHEHYQKNLADFETIFPKL